MFLLAGIAAIVAIGFFLSVLFNRNIEETLCLSSSAIILFLYILSAVTNAITAAFVYSIYALALVLFLFSVVYARRKKIANVYKRILTPGFIVFLVFAVLLYIQANGVKLTGFDEFTHWGLTVKNMVYLETLSTNALSTTDFKTYPPAIALFQFFFVKPAAYNDSVLLYAYNLLMVAFLIPILAHFEWKQWKKIPAMMAIVYLLPLTITYETTAWYTIYVDCMLAVLLAYVLFSYFSKPKTGVLFTAISIGCGMMMLSLTKPTGNGIGIIALGMMGVDWLLFQKQRRRRDQLILVLTGIAVLALAYISWKLVLHANQIGAIWHSHADVSAVVSLILGKQEPWRYDVITSFLNALGSNSLMHRSAFQISYYGWMAIWALMLVLPLCIVKDKLMKKRIQTMAASLEIGFALYCVSLVFVYLFVVSKEEGLMLASLTRYLSDFITGITIFVVFYIIYLFTSQQTKDTLHKNLGPISGFAVRNIAPLILAFLIFITPVSALTKALLIPGAAARTSRNIRASYQATENLEGILDKSTDRVFIVIQDDNSYHYWICRYNLTPVRTNPWNTWKVTVTYDEWIDELKTGEYSYVFIVNIDSYFTDVFSDMFGYWEVTPQTLYKIQYDQDTMMLIPAVFEQ